MKNRKKWFSLLLITALLASLLSACGGGEAAYSVTIVDAMGQPVTSGVVVKFMQNGTQAGMQVVNENGVAEKQLPKGDYTVELQFTDSDAVYKYDTSELTLSANKTQLQIVLSFGLGDKSQSLTVGTGEFEAWYVTEGGTEITLDAQNRSYFLFAPTQSGTFEFSLNGSDAPIGYYGAPHFVQENSVAEVKDNKFTVSIRPDMISNGATGTTVLVIGVDAGEGNAVLGIQRIGDHEWSVADEAWTGYEPTHTPSADTFPGTPVKEFDLTAPSYTLVVDAQGFYHLDSENGPLVLVRLGKKAQLKYLDPFETVLEHTGMNRYFYDENGEFLKKENYSDCLMTYIGCVDQDTGLYPLTEDLKYIIQNSGEQNGWWDPQENYIFLEQSGEKVVGINADIAWLFMCCYTEG
jgi:hypothetical protein